MTLVYLMTSKRTLPNFGYVFEKCHEFNINLNLEKCMFLVYSWSYLGMLFPRWENYLIQKRPWQSWICSHRKHLETYKFSMGWPNSIDVSSRTLPSWWPHHKILTQNGGVCVDYRMLGSVGGHKTKVFGYIDLNCTQMGHGVLHPHICIKSSSYVGSKSYQKMWSANCICLQILKQCKEKLHHH